MTIVATAALAACGGGGGSGDDAPASGLPATASEVTGDIETGNYATIAAAAVGAIRPSTGLSSIGGSGLVDGAGVEGDRSSAATASDTNRRSALKVKSLAVHELTEPCESGGSVSVVLNDADGNEDYSAGDSWTESYNNCSMGGLTINGGGSVSVRSASASAMDLSLSVNQLSMDGMMMNGPARIQVASVASGVSATITFAGVTLASSGAETLTLGAAVALTFNSSTEAVTAAFNGPVAYGADSFWFAQSAAFALPAGKGVPRSGSLTVSDKDGDRVVVSGSASGLTYTFYAAGSETAVASQPGPSAD